MTLRRGKEELQEQIELARSSHPGGCRWEIGRPERSGGRARRFGLEIDRLSRIRAALERSEGDAHQVEIGEVILGLVGAGRGHGDLDAAHADANMGADLEELEPNGATGGAGQLGVPEPDPAQPIEQDVGEGREPQAQLVGAHRRCGRAIGEQVELLLFDPVLDLAADAIDVLVETARVDLGGAERRHDEPWV